MKKLLVDLTVILFFTLLASLASAQWKRIYLPAVQTHYNVTSLASSAGNIYAGGSLSGSPLLFHSSDDGANWQSVSDDPLFTPVIAIAANKKNVYVCLEDGVMSSSDNGAHWKNITPPSTPANVVTAQCIAVSGSDLFVGTVGSSSGDGLFASNDNGVTWDTIGTGYGDTIGLSEVEDDLFALYGDNTALYAGTTKGVFVSSFPEQGGGWMPLNTGIAKLNVKAIVGIDSILFAGTLSGIYSTTSGGSVWSSAALLSGPILSLATNGEYLFAGQSAGDGVIYTNDGMHWNSANDGLTDTAMQAGGIALTISGDYVYLATVNGGLWQRPLSDFEGVSEAFINQPELSQNFPNPFNTSTTIHYSLSEQGHVSLAVYNMLGERVAVLKNDIEPAGSNEATFESGALPSGLYCYRLSTSNGGTTTRIMQIER